MCHTMMQILNHLTYELKKDPASSTLISNLIISNIHDSAKKKKKSNGIINPFAFNTNLYKGSNEATEKLC